MFEIGTTLRQARERRQLGLDRCEAETKIRARYLRALEDEDFDVLPGPTFVRGFLRSLRQPPRARRAAVRRRVQLAPLRPARRRRLPAPPPDRARAPQPQARVAHHPDRDRRDRRPRGARDRGRELSRQHRARTTPLPAATSAPSPTGVGNSALTVTTIAAARRPRRRRSTTGQVTVVAERAVLRDGLRGRGHEGPRAVLRHARSRHEARRGQAAAGRGRLHVRARQRRRRARSWSATGTCSRPTT